MGSVTTLRLNYILGDYMQPDDFFAAEESRQISTSDFWQHRIGADLAPYVPPAAPKPPRKRWREPLHTCPYPGCEAQIYRRSTTCGAHREAYKRLMKGVSA